MPACCYQLKLARKAETLSLWQKHCHISAQRSVVFSFVTFLWIVTAENSKTQIAENDLIHFPDAIFPLNHDSKGNLRFYNLY